MPNSNFYPSESEPSAKQSPPVVITPELVRKIAAKVYTLMLVDLKIERERCPLSPQKVSKPRGEHDAA